MAILWPILKRAVINELATRNLKSPGTRKNALEKIEEYLRNGDLKEYYNKPELILEVDKNKFKEMLTKRKTYALNDAESSIVNEIYNQLEKMLNK